MAYQSNSRDDLDSVTMDRIWIVRGKEFIKAEGFDKIEGQFKKSSLPAANSQSQHPFRAINKMVSENRHQCSPVAT